MTSDPPSPPSAKKLRPAGGSSAWLVVIILVIALIGGCVALAPYSPVEFRNGTLLILLLLSVVGELLRRVEIGRSTSLSVVAVIILAAVPLVGPIGAALVGALSALLVQSRLVGSVGRLFNVAQQGLIGLVGGVAYLGANGEVGFGPTMSAANLLLHVLVPMVAAALVMLLLNAFLVAVMAWAWSGGSVRAMFLDTLALAWLTYLGFGLVGFTFVILWQVEQLGPVSVVLVVVPLMLAQWSIQEQANEREAQLKTVQTLVAAAETGRFQRAGQSERVGQVAEAVATELRLGPRRMQSLRFAASLHNIGLVSTPPTTEDTAALDRSRTRQILAHPGRGVAMLRNIDFLGDAIAGVRSHHERWDGRGFPERLEGAEIPLLARVLAVADTYVALTGTAQMSASRALDLMTQRAGTHLDPRCMRALRRAWQRGRLGSTPTLGPLHGPDHDHPDVLDALSERLRPV